MPKLVAVETRDGRYLITTKQDLHNAILEAKDSGVEIDNKPDIEFESDESYILIEVRPSIEFE